MDDTGRLRRASRPGLRSTIVLAAYALAVILLPLAHHDLACHLKSTTHCTTCIVGASAETAADPASLARFWLDDAGTAIIEAESGVGLIAGRRASGRAPPASA